MDRLSCTDIRDFYNYIKNLPPMPSDEGMTYLIEKNLKDGRTLEDLFSLTMSDSNRYKDEWIDFFKRHGYIK